MNVVINPSGQAGFSFKGLHNYCAHDKTGNTSERVEWISTRNLAASPHHAYKSMINTAESKNQLKRQAGVRAGRPSENGDVLHIVMCYDIDEPWNQETCEAAAKDLLSRLGSTRAKSSGVRQFADEHQVVMYAHNDTKNRHVHLMVNRVHPRHGRALPDSNDQLKASRWALGFSKKHGTDHKTPARGENMAARDRGEYVKAERRKSRKAFEEEKALKEASNDNSRVKAFLDNQKRKDAALYAAGRLLAKKQQQRIAAIEERFENRKADADALMRKQINKAKANIRETYRPQIRDLKTRQTNERKTFEALETSFFGRTKNAIGAVRDAFDKNDKGLISRSFRILSSSGERKAYFERGQQRELSALESKQTGEFKAAEARAKEDRKAAYAEAQNERLEENQLAKTQWAEENSAHRAEWKQRNAERKEEFAQFENIEQNKPRIGGDFSQVRMTDEYFKDLEKRMGLSEDFDGAQQEPTQEQGNERDDGQERS